MNWTKCLLVLLFALMAGCGAPANRNSGGNANSAATAGASLSDNDRAAAMEGLLKAVGAQMDVKSFRARFDANTGGVEMASNLEYVAPDRYHMKGEEGEVILIGNTAWSRQSDGTWQKEPVDADQMVGSVRNPKMIDEIRKNAIITSAGPDTLDGKPMTIYEYTMRTPESAEMTIKGKAWISSADNLPHRMESESNSRGQTMKMTITYFDYNADIKLQPPKQR